MASPYATRTANRVALKPFTVASFWCAYVLQRVYKYTPILYLRGPSDPSCLRAIFSASERQRNVPSLAGMCAGINAHRGGFLAYHRMDDYAMPGLMRQGIEKLEKRSEAGGVERELRWVPKGQECILKGTTGVLRTPRDRRMYRVVCLFVQGRHCVPGSFQRVPRFPACHASCFASVARKHSEILSPQGSGLMFCSPRENGCRKQNSRIAGENRRWISVYIPKVFINIFSVG